MVENLAETSVLTWAGACVRTRAGAKGQADLQAVDIPPLEVTQGQWCSSSLQGRQQLMLTADSQKIEVFFPTKMQAEDVLNYCKMEVGGGEGSKMAI